MWNHFIDRKVYLELANGRRYQGVVKNISSQENNKKFISIIDKYGHKVIFDSDEISILQEED